MSSFEDLEVVVVGAGPGGTAAAIELARAGREVVLIEKKQFPRDKVCGGCVSGNGTLRLRRLLGDDRPLPGIDGRQVTFVMGRYRLTHHASAGEIRMAPRSTMDAALAEAASAAGAEVRFGHAAHVRREPCGWVVDVGGNLIRPRHLLWASGLGHISGKLPIEARDPRRRLISQQWVMPVEAALPEVGCVELHWMRGGYVGLATPEANRCVVALAAQAPRQGNARALALLYRQNPRAKLWRSIPIDAPERYGSKGCGGFPWRPSRLGDGNLLLVGDAAGYEEPYSGEGIGQAMHSGCCAASAVLASLAASSHGAPADVLARYTRQMYAHHRRVCRRTRYVSRILNSYFMHAVVSLPPLLPEWLLTRIVARMHVRSD